MNYFNALFIVLLANLFNQDDFLVKQADVTVQLSELDAYVFSMNDKSRVKFSQNIKSIENTIITLLNINIVNQYINNSGLNDLNEFKKIEDIEFEVLDEQVSKFAKALDLETEQVNASFTKYKIENEYYRTLLQYLNEQANEKVTPLAKEFYLINKKEYITPEKRNLSVIVLTNEINKEPLYKTLLNELRNKPIQFFEKKAKEFSVDSSKDLNMGNWGEFRKVDFNYTFNETVFTAGEGVIPQLFEQENNIYIIRVNKVLPPSLLSFDDVSEKIIEKLKGKAVSQEFQSIINRKGIHEIVVNPELVAHVFERYKVFSEE